MKTPIELEAIMAIADNGAFGIHQGLPWHIPSELEYFRSYCDNVKKNSNTRSALYC